MNEMRAEQQPPEPKPETTTFWEQRGDTMHRVADVPARYRDSIYAAMQEAGQTTHGNSEPVRVIGIDEAESHKWHPPRGKATPCHEEQLFPSALAASHHLGFATNEVADRLGKSRREEERQAIAKHGPQHTTRLRPSVTIRGVTLQYEKDVRG